MKRTETRDRILEAALELFSQKGYTGTSVDEIAESIGIKGPSLYKHFSGKQEIFNEMLLYMRDCYQANQLNNPDSFENITSTEQLKAMVMAHISYSMQDPMTVKTRKVLALEQFRSAEVAAITTMTQLTMMEERYGKIFRNLMDRNILRKQDVDMMTIEFVAPITVLLDMVDREPARAGEALRRIEKHVDYFLSVYEVYKEII